MSNNARMQATASKSKTKAQTKPKSPPKARKAGPARKANASPPARRPASPAAASPSGERHQNEGHGRRLTLAFEALEAFPALAESRNRLLRWSPKSTSRLPTWSPPSSPTWRLITAVLRLANQVEGKRGQASTRSSRRSRC